MTKWILIGSTISSVLNLGLDYLFVLGKFGFPKLGIAGAAIATVLGTVVASIMSIASISKKSCFILAGFRVGAAVLEFALHRTRVEGGYTDIVLSYLHT